VQPQYYNAIIQQQYPDTLSKLLELGYPGFFGCYISNRREANTVNVKSAAAATAADVPKLSNASITGEQTDRLKKLIDLGEL